MADQLSLTGKRWVISETDEEAVRALQDELRIHPTLCQLLVQRGINSYDEAYHFFRPAVQHLNDPFLMKGMEAAVDRIDAAVKQGENIMVYGDYDVDGTTSVALMYSFLKNRHDKLEYYIPDRYTEGYGISYKGIDHAAAEGFSLIIALDCGIRAVDKVEYAKEKGIDFIICDHHLPGDTVPDAVAVLDPKQPGCPYPYKELSGCGIGFKLAQALAAHWQMDDEVLEDLLDLVVVSIAADIVPITGENRILAALGLEKLNSRPRQGLKSLLESSNMKRELTISDIVFTIGPRINAAGRLDHARQAVKLLISGESGHSQKKADILNQHNTDRKELDKLITTEAINMIAADDELLARKSTVVFHPDWHKGVIGIVASRLIERYYRPTIVLTESEGMVTGSARSVRGFDVHEALGQCSDLLEQFGGHKYAAGMSLLPENLERFQQRFEEVVADTIDPELLVPVVNIDATLPLAVSDFRFYKVLRQFAPFGPGNMKPVFLSTGVYDDGRTRVVGENHLKLSIQQGSKQSRDGIGFGLGEHLKKLHGGSKNPFNICYTLEENEWQGYKSIQLNVKDLGLIP